MTTQPEDRSTACNKRIDVHHHFTTPHYNEATQQQFARETAGMPGATGSLNWSLQNSIDAMDQAGVSTSILSLSNPGPLVDGIEATRALTRHCNDFGATAVSDFAGRFGHFASLPLPDVEGSLREIEYALDTLKADGFIVHTNDSDIWLGDEKYWPVYEELDRRSAVLFVHPAIPCCCHGIPISSPPAILELPIDTARAVTNLIYSGAAIRFPNIRFIFCHGGGVLPMLTNRIETVGRVRPELGANLRGSATEMLRTFYYDTAQIYTPHAFAAVRTLLPTSQLLFGTDLPYANLKMCVDNLTALVPDAGDLLAIECENVLALLPQLNQS